MTGRAIPAGPVPRAPAASPTVSACPEVAAASPLISRFAAWLLIAVALDLVVSRIVVRLAIFIPKGEPWATASSWLGGIGAVTDAVVPIMSLLLLGAMLLAAGRGSRMDRLLAVGCSLVAAAGLALVVLAPSPVVASLVDGIVVVVAFGAVASWRPAAGVPRAASLGVRALAGALAMAAVVRLVDASAAIGASAGFSSQSLGAWISIGGQWCFVAGAALLGIGGLRERLVEATSRSAVAYLAAGVVVGSLLMAAAWRAPEHAGQLIIWSAGLTGVVPTVALAVAACLAVAGMPALARSAPRVAIGTTVVLLAGYGLAASGLVLAGLLGLLVARQDRDAEEGLELTT